MELLEREALEGPRIVVESAPLEGFGVEVSCHWEVYLLGISKSIEATLDEPEINNVILRAN